MRRRPRRRRLSRLPRTRPPPGHSFDPFDRRDRAGHLLRHSKDSSSLVRTYYFDDRRDPAMSDSVALPGWPRPANHVVRALSRLRMPLGTIHVLTVPGRRSGRPRSTPVSPLTVLGAGSSSPRSRRVTGPRNARAAGHGESAETFGETPRELGRLAGLGTVTFIRSASLAHCRGRRHQPVEFHEVTDPSLRRLVLRSFPAAVPGGVRFFIRLGLVTAADPAQFAAAADRVTVFELLPDRGCATDRSRSG